MTKKNLNINLNQDDFVIAGKHSWQCAQSQVTLDSSPILNLHRKIQLDFLLLWSPLLNLHRKIQLIFLLWSPFLSLHRKTQLVFNYGIELVINRPFANPSSESCQNNSLPYIQQPQSWPLLCAYFTQYIFHLLSRYLNISCAKCSMSKVVGKLLLALTWWQAVNFSFPLLLFSHKVIFLSPLLLLCPKLKNLPLWSTCHMAQYNRGRKIDNGIWRILLWTKLKKRSHESKLCPKDIFKNNLSSSMELPNFIWNHHKFYFYQERVNVKLICPK